MNGYNFDFAVSAQISAKVVEEMVRKAVEEQTGKQVQSVSFRTREESDYMDRYSTTVFDGCTVTFEQTKATQRGPYGDR